MKKWLGLYIVICLVALGVLSGVAGRGIAKEASFGIVTQEGGYDSQVIRTKEHDYVLYQNPGQEKFLITKTDKEFNGYETLGTAHKDGVYYLYRFLDGDGQFFGIEPLGAAKGEGEWVVPAFAAEGTFLAAGSNEKAIFCSILGEDGRTIIEYALPFAGTLEWQERQRFSLPEGHFAVCGAYEEDTLWFVREDGKVFSWGILLEEQKVSAEDTVLVGKLRGGVAPGAEGKWSLTGMKEAAANYVLPVLLIVAVAVALFYGSRKRNHLVYRMICCTEVLCLLALCYAGYAFANRLTRQEVLETGIEAGHVLEEMKLSQRADGTVEPEAYWAAMEKRAGLLEDLIILQPEDGEVLLAKTLPAGVDVADYFGLEAETLAAQVVNGNEAVMTKLPKGTGEVYAVALRDWTDMSPDSVLLAVLSESGIQNSIRNTVSSVWTLIGGLMALLTAAHIGLFIYFSNRWRKFQEGITFVATEKKAYPETPAYDDGLQHAWMPLESIGHNLNRLYYERELLYRRYYRFVPKGMENLLKKPELADIEIGDRNKIRGCMVDFLLEDMKGLDGAEYMEMMTKSLELMHSVRELRGGIFLSAAADLQERKIFFEQNARKALQFAVDLLHVYAERGLLTKNDMIFMLHAAEFQYGISGVKDMTTPYMYSRQESILELYTKALARAKVRIAMTEQTRQLIGEGFSTRYIGFVSGGEAVGSLKLYECLDAYAEDKRKLMLETDTMFQRGLQLFYSNDFYLARNTFNEVLKLNEQDHIARWYLFHCEYHLNKPEAEVSYGLFESAVLEQDYHRS